MTLQKRKRSKSLTRVDKIVLWSLLGCIALAGTGVFGYQWWDRQRQRKLDESRRALELTRNYGRMPETPTFDRNRKTSPTKALSGSEHPAGGGLARMNTFLRPGSPPAEESEDANKAGLTANEQDIEIATGVKLALVWCPPGTFLMGSPDSEKGRDHGEMQHQVRLTKGFWIGKYEVTQVQWQAVMDSNPSQFKGAQNPVENVSWKDVQQFLEKLGGGFRLPTEAEWEYACRADSTTAYCFGDDEGRLGDYAWFDKNSGKTTHPVGEKKPNAWGLCDMHGNVWEWCADWYQDDLGGAAVTDPAGPPSGSDRVGRGGCRDSLAGLCRSAGTRWVFNPHIESGDFAFTVGLRVAANSPPPRIEASVRAERDARLERAERQAQDREMQKLVHKLRAGGLTKEQIKPILVGKTLQEVISIMGPPNFASSGVEDSGEGRIQYNSGFFDVVTQKKEWLWISFSKGRVTGIDRS